MKAGEFLKLVGSMMTKQQDYFTARRNGSLSAQRLLIEAKGLEKLVWQVVKSGVLEPDLPEQAGPETMSFLDGLDNKTPTITGE